MYTILVKEKFRKFQRNYIQGGGKLCFQTLHHGRLDLNRLFDIGNGRLVMNDYDCRNLDLNAVLRMKSK